MGTNMKEKARCRLLKAVLAGLLAGMAILSVFIIPSFITKNIAKSADAARQENLIPARGEAFADYHTTTVSLTALLEGRPHDGISVSPDFRKWYTPQNGDLTLTLAPGTYDFRVAYENRMVYASYDVKPDGANQLVLDVDGAPTAPKLLMLDIPNDETTLLPLDITGASHIAVERTPSGVSIIRQDAFFALSIDGTLLSEGFCNFTLRSENDSGEALTHVGVRVPRPDTPIPIYTADDLEKIRQNLSGSYILMNDLDLSGVDDWEPIGSITYPFTGFFDGGGHEITGFHSMRMLADGEHFSFFNYLRNAEIRNLIFREPEIRTTTNEGDSTVSAVFAYDMTQSLMENCAVIGGNIAPENGGACGITYGNGGFMLGVFNSANVLSDSPNAQQHNVGGISGASSGYGAYLANEGEVTGSHLAGGIVGYHIAGYLRRCVSSGYVWGNTLVGEFPTGGIIQTQDNDGDLYSSAAYCYYVRGQSGVGGKSFMYGVLNTLEAITWDELRTPEAMPYLGSFGGEYPDWAYASLDAVGPIPYGIFKKQAETPMLPDTGYQVTLSPVDGLRYCYTLDGSDPRVFCVVGVESLDVTLKQGQTLTVFATRQGYRDSDTVFYQPNEGVR